VKKALIVLEKEWLELRLQRGLLLATFFLPPLTTILAIGVFFVVSALPGNVRPGTTGPLPPDLAGLPPAELAQTLVGRQFSVLFLLLPVFVPSVLASYAIVGEKRDRTLEPVLATPIRTWELLLGKALGALVPALSITLASAGLFVAGILAFAVTDRVRELVVTPGWLLAVGLDAPMLKFGPPPMTSRMSKPWARACPAPASNVTAANSKAKTRIMFVPAKNQIRCETGHNWRDFASNEPMSAASFNHWRYRNNTASAANAGSVRSSKS